MQWSIEQLQQFVTTAEQGSFSAAGRHLGRAQSAVSTAIANLEVDLGVTLFDRSRRNAQLTDAGKIILREAQELLRQAQGLTQRARALESGDEAILSVALDEALPNTSLGTLVREISERFPDIELTMLNGTATEVACYVEQQRATIAFHFDRGPVNPCFDQLHIGTLPQGVFVVRGHPLADGRVVRRQDLARYRQLVMEADDLHEATYSPRIWRSDSFYSIADMVADNLGWAILPLNIAHYEGYPQPLQEVPCPSLALPRLSVRMLWLQGNRPGAIAHWMQQRFAELLLQTSP